MSTSGVGDAGDDVGVGHHPVGGVDEAGALDALAAAVGAADADDAAGGARDVGVGEHPPRAGRHRDDPLRRERLEVAREERRTDDVVERRQLRARGGGQDVVDLGQDLRVAHQRRDAARARSPESATPSAQATSSAATALSTAPPTASSARTGCQVIWSRMRAPTSWNSACPSEAQRITMKTAASETRIDGVALPSAVGASQTPISPPSRRPEGREGAGDEALPVAGDGVQHDDEDQHPVEQVHSVAPRDRAAAAPPGGVHPAACTPGGHAPRARPRVASSRGSRAAGR